MRLKTVKNRHSFVTHAASETLVFGTGEAVHVSASVVSVPAVTSDADSEPS